MEDIEKSYPLLFAVKMNQLLIIDKSVLFKLNFKQFAYPRQIGRADRKSITLIESEYSNWKSWPLSGAIDIRFVSTSTTLSHVARDQ